MSSASTKAPSRVRCRRHGVSAASFACSGLVSIVTFLIGPATSPIPAIAAVSLVILAALGAIGGHLGSAPLGRAAVRVTLGGLFAVVVTTAIGRIFGVAVN
jgi:VIT1/CCC1 family predicted Fe2+/Mn2+ transporter